jgi:sugar lactone lactonase YvrE
VNRYDPLSGSLIGKVKVPALNVTACAFGGADMKQLFITTARKGLNEEQLQKYPLSGSLFYLNTEIKGAQMNKFIV